jgi:hypothetical protein
MTGVNGRWSFDGAAVCPKGNVLKTLLIYNYGLAEEEISRLWKEVPPMT